MAMAHGLPFLVILRCSELIMPAMVTVGAVGPAVVARQRGDRAVGRPGQDVLDAEERVVGHVQAEHLALGGQQCLLVPLRPRGPGARTDRRRARRRRGRRTASPARSPPGACRNHGVDGALVDGDQTAPGVPEGVERAGLDQRLDRPLVADHAGTLRRKSSKEAYRPFSLAGRHDRVDDVGADVADRGEAEPDVGADRGEVRRGLVDVGRQHLDAHPAALVQVQRGLVLVVAHAREQRGHVLGRVVRLEVRRPVRDQAVRRGVRLVEGVVGERDQDVPQRLDRPAEKPRSRIPSSNATNSLSSTSRFFLPIARRSRSAWPRV